MRNDLCDCLVCEDREKRPKEIHYIARENMQKEFQIISKYFAPLGRREDFCNDGAVLEISRNEKIVASKDVFVSGSHFFSGTEPSIIAKRSLRASLSDLAAMGAHPLYYLVGLSVPKDVQEDWFAGFASGLREDNDEFGIYLKGGDTTSNNYGAIFISCTVFGKIAVDSEPLSRCSAKSGDTIYVSGPIGSSYIGFLLKSGGLSYDAFKDTKQFTEAFDLPKPKIELGKSLLGLATACQDISDGLLQDLSHLCACSELDAYIESQGIPFAHGALEAASVLQLLKGGEDFELLFSLPDSVTLPAGFEVWPIGRFEQKSEINTRIFLDGCVVENSESSFSHF